MNRLDTNELGLKLRIAVFEKHLNDFAKVTLEFVEIRALAVGSRPTGHMTNVDAGVRIAFYDNVEHAHSLGPFSSAG